MTITVLTKWGNSIGIRIPSSILKEAGLLSGEALEIKVNEKGVLSLIPVENKQAGWLEKFNAVADLHHEEVHITNDFDVDEWTW